LLNVDKVYQEQEYSRASFAAELGVSEATVSRLANDYLRKTIPQLLNEYRVEDAKVLLKETDAPIQIVAKEAGFPSLATFNRVFRDLSGKTPSEYRKETASHFVKLTG
jgi:AraC-like DNA-binding protein